MKKTLNLGVRLSSDSGYTMCKVNEPSMFMGSYSESNYYKLKRWCRKNVKGNWAVSEPVTNAGTNNPHSYYAYFGFADTEDLLMFQLMSSDITQNPMWESRVRFTVTEYITPEQEGLLYD